MLAAVPELNFARLEGSERCCGGAGIYNLLEPQLSREVLAEKLGHIEATGAQVLATEILAAKCRSARALCSQE